MPGTVPGPHTEQWARGTAWTVLWFSAVCLLNAVVGHLNKASQDQYPFLHHLLLAHTKFLRNEIALDRGDHVSQGRGEALFFGIYVFVLMEA